MSRTYRRTTFNVKRRFFNCYWCNYSEKEVLDGSEYLKPYQYHSDNYYSKSNGLKQFFKTLSYKGLRQEFRQFKDKGLINPEVLEAEVLTKKPRNIKWDLW